MQHCQGTVRFIIYNIETSEHKSGKTFLKIWHRWDCYSTLIVQQVIMLLFDCGINTEIFCDISKTQTTYESIRSCKQEAQLLQRDRATCIVSFWCLQTLIKPQYNYPSQDFSIKFSLMN